MYELTMDSCKKNKRITVVDERECYDHDSRPNGVVAGVDTQIGLPISNNPKINNVANGIHQDPLNRAASIVSDQLRARAAEQSNRI